MMRNMKIPVVLMIALLISGSRSMALPFAYVTNSALDNVSPLDLATNMVGTPITVGDLPRSIAITADSSRAYVPNGNSASVSVIDLVTNMVVSTIAVGSSPIFIATAITSNGPKAYVTNSGSGSVSVIDVNTNVVDATITVGSQPRGIAIMPDGTKAYVCNSIDNTVSVIDLSNNMVVATISVGLYPFNIAITPDGTKAYVCNRDDSTVSVINMSTNLVVDTIMGFSNPVGIAITPNGFKAYICNQGSGDVSVINMSTNMVVATISMGTVFYGIAITQDGTKAYVCNPGFNTVSVVDVNTDAVDATIMGFSNPLAIAIRLLPLPQANPASVSTSFETSLLITVSGSDSLNSMLTFTSVTPPAHGTLGSFISTSSTTANVLYTPSSGYIGSDSFTFSVNNGFVTSLPALVSIAITGPTPNANPTSVSTVSNSLLITVSGSDSINSMLTFTSVTGPSHGTLGSFISTSSTTAQVLYTSEAGYVGMDSFTFSVNNGFYESSAALVSITITPTTPQANPASASTLIDTSLLITVSGSDSLNSMLTFTSVTSPSHGTLGSFISTSSTTANVLYTPSSGYIGSDSFTFSVNNGFYESLPALLSIAIAAPSPSPVIATGSALADALISKYNSRVASQG